MTSRNFAEEQISSIFADYASGSVRYQRALEGALVAIQKGFSREGHYLLELIQNAEDAGATSFECVIEGQTVVVRNNGAAFSPSNVDALCDVGHSSKSPQNYIGYLGVGFKSVFLISDHVEVHSPPYHFGFWPEEGRTDFPWQVAPRWTEQALVPPWTTEFDISVRTPILAEKLSLEMGHDSLDARILLFLQSLKEMTLEDRNNGFRRVIKRTPLGEGNYRLEETIGDTPTAEKWKVFASAPLTVPVNVREDWFTKNWDRDQAQHRAVSIAFKLTDGNELETTQGTLHMGVFSYLPVREERSRLKFLVQADFLTSVGRTRVQEEAPWNMWLAQEVVELCKKESHTLLSDLQWRKKALEVLWPQDQEANDFFAVHAEQPLRTFLKEGLQLPAWDGAWVNPSEALYVSDPQMWELVGPSELEQLYARKPLAQDVIVPTVFPGPDWVQRAPSFLGNSNTSGFVSKNEGKTFLEAKASTNDVAFFKRLYQTMDALFTSVATYRKSPLIYAYSVLTNKDTVEQPGPNVFFKPKRLTKGMEDTFIFVHPDIEADVEARRLLEKLGVSELPESKIREAASDAVLPEVRKSWPVLPETERRSWLIKFKQMVESGEVDAGDLDFLTVPTKGRDEWLNPDELLFPEEYSPAFKIEALVRSGLLDDISIKFVSPDLPLLGGSLEQWKQFLIGLGVGKPENEQPRRNRWSSRVGVMMARRYESKRGRAEIHEVTESERGVSDPGYDLVCKDAASSDERFIEAKATGGAGDFTLRPTTLKQMFTESGKRKFFIYVTSNALVAPRLHVIKADQLTQDILLKVGEIQLDVRNVPVVEAVNFDVLAT